jgi:hypothetical protein
MTFKPSESIFLIWQFLNQPVFDRQCPLILNPHRFWRFYQMRHLERCWFKTFRPEERFRN